ncbi:MAG: hypothetical protein ACRCZI_03115 [Cetobacterium sp.]
MSLLKSWTEADLDPAYFWQVTPREMQAILDGAAGRIRREEELSAWLAWHTAALGRVKKMPRLMDMLPRKPKPSQTIEEQIAIAKAWDARIKSLQRQG